MLNRILFITILGVSLSGWTQKFDMKAELAELAKKDTFPDNFGFDNYHAVKLYHEIIANTTDEIQRNSLIYEMCWQYIFAGYPDSALMWMDSIPYDIWDNARKANPNYDKEFMTGLSYIRIAEQRNCQKYHNEFSCILPLNEDAQHKVRFGSENAITAFEKVLERSPDHYPARWLLNIAYMTLGRYPQDVPKKYFIDFEHFPHDKNVPYFRNVAEELGVNTHTFYGGTVVEDFNNDGFLDIFTSSGDLKTNVELYISNTKGGFVQATKHAGLDGITGGANATHADYNNDGHVDIYLMRGGWLGPKAGKNHPNSLLRNNGDGTFTDVTKEVGLLEYYPSHTACFADYDNDGWLDLFVGNEDGKSQLYHNDNGTFTDVSQETGIYTTDFVKGSFWGDYDKDGYMDLYITVAGKENYLFRNKGPNENGKYYFNNVAREAKVNRPISSFPTFMFDFNNDGFLDIFVASYPSDVARLAHQYIVDTANIEFSSLHINNGDGTFTDFAVKTNLGRSIEAMGLNYGDIDNDGWLDFYVGTGYPSFEALMPNLMFRNNQGREFLEVIGSGFGHVQKGHGIGFGDMDNDGDQDIYASMGGFMQADKFWNVMLENPGNKNNWITLKLEGAISNKSAIGAEVTIIAKKDNLKQKFFRVVSPGGSFGSNSLQLEIGLGRFDQIESIEVNWPASKTKIVYKDVPINRFYKVIEGEYELKALDRKQIKFQNEAGNSHDGHHHHHH